MRPILLAAALLALSPAALAASGTRTSEPDAAATERGTGSASSTVEGPRTPQKGKEGRKGNKKRGGKGEGAARKGKGGKKRVTIDAVSPLHGVLLYGPKLGTHDDYANAENRKKPTVVKRKDLPVREVKRDDSIAVGLVAGTLIQGYDDGTSFGDLGLGLKGRYRPMEYLGLELGLQRNGDTLMFGGERAQTLISGSVQAFVFPWNKISPFASVGLTQNNRRVDDPSLDAVANLTGAHLGVGVEYSLSDKVALDLEGRTIRWLNRADADSTNPGALSVNGGVVFHF